MSTTPFPLGRGAKCCSTRAIRSSYPLSSLASCSSGLPQEERKQVFGDELPIIGFKMDPNLMRVRMSEKSKLQLIMAIQDFALHGTRHNLRDFQRIAGYLNWALNVYLLTAGKLFQKALLWVNWNVEREFTWVVNHLLRSDGIYFLRSISWSSGDHSTSILRVYCDTSPFALGIWYPSLHLGLQAPAHETFAQHGGSIFYLKSLCVCAAILDAASRLSAGQCLGVFTDNINTVQLFNLLSALPAFNWMLIQVAALVLRQELDFWVFHVPGVHNVVADALSRLQNAQLVELNPELTISTFQPPRPALGAAGLRALLLLIPMLYSASILYLVMPCSLCFHSYGFVLIALCLLAVGLCPGCTASSLVLLEGIPCVLVVRHHLLLQVFLLPRSKPLAGGSQTPSCVIFVAILHFCRQFCFMVSPFMILPLLMYHSLFLCHFSYQSLSQLPISFLPPVPPI